MHPLIIRIKKIKEPKIAACADDMAIAMNDFTRIKEIAEEFEAPGAASGCTVNKQKNNRTQQQTLEDRSGEHNEDHQMERFSKF